MTEFEVCLFLYFFSGFTFMLPHAIAFGPALSFIPVPEMQAHGYNNAGQKKNPE
jgi:hypothetical protein